MTDPSPWREIESAPKKGDVLLYHPPVYRKDYPQQQTHGEWIHVGQPGMSPNRPATHWAPIPKPLPPSPKEER